ncbi:MAG TPA: ferric reductase-like transmembrane domain-containing protein [Gaiellaceae bacterium]|nr:ferric reductase-like transmembrane domain-containing protein [Gaiellaceae bacterium]
MILATSGPSAYWYATRGTGVVALLLLTGGVLLGVLASTRWTAPRWPRFVVAGLHRNLTLLALAFVVVHVVTTVLDGYAPIGLRDAVLPFASSYRPVWLGLGAVALDLLLALILTSLSRARLGLRTWKLVHWLAYASWPVALVHAFGTGSDARAGWFGLVALGSAAAVVLAVLWRVVEAREGPGAVRLAGGVAALALPVAIAVWAVGGPLASGWARRAGTPVRLLAARAPASGATARAATGAVTLPAAPFRAPVAGTFSTSAPGSDGLVTVAMRAQADGGSKGLLDVVLRGVPLDGGGVQMTGSRVTYGPRAAPGDYSGQIVSLDGSRLVASVQDARGDALDLTLLLRLDPSNRTLSGSLRVT